MTTNKGGGQIKYRLVNGVMYKTCSMCKIEKSESEFYRHKSKEKLSENESGLYSKCKECSRKYQTEETKTRRSRLSRTGYLDVSAKKCARCHIVKNIDSFSKNTASKDGRSSWCRECNSRYSKNVYASLPKKPKREIYVYGNFGNILGRICLSCKNTKPADEFGMTKSGRLYSRCKVCLREQSKANRILSEKTILGRHGEKRCPKCDEIKRVEDFSSHGVTKKGSKKTGLCKKCSNEKMSNWRKTHRRTRRPREKDAIGKYSTGEWNIMLDICNHRCLRCNSTQDVTIDHVVPLSRNGTNYISNLQPLCIKCNSSKTNRQVIDYRWNLIDKLKEHFDMSLPMYSD